MYFLDDLVDDGVLGILDGHHKDAVALALCGDTVEPALQGLDAGFFVVSLRLLRAELMDSAQELLEVGDGDGAVLFVFRRLVGTEAHNDAEGQRIEAGCLGCIQGNCISKSEWVRKGQHAT